MDIQTKCRCGHAAEVTLRWSETWSSGQGEATRRVTTRPMCRRCADHEAFDALAGGVEEASATPLVPDFDAEIRSGAFWSRFDLQEGD